MADRFLASCCLGFCSTQETSKVAALDTGRDSEENVKPACDTNPELCAINAMVPPQACQEMRVRATASKRGGEKCKMVIFDPEDKDLAWKVEFDDGCAEWFPINDIEVHNSTDARDSIEISEQQCATKEDSDKPDDLMSASTCTNSQVATHENVTASDDGMSRPFSPGKEDLANCDEMPTPMRNSMEGEESLVQPLNLVASIGDVWDVANVGESNLGADAPAYLPLAEPTPFATEKPIAWEPNLNAPAFQPQVAHPFPTWNLSAPVFQPTDAVNWNQHFCEPAFEVMSADWHANHTMFEPGMEAGYSRVPGWHVHVDVLPHEAQAAWPSNLPAGCESSIRSRYVEQGNLYREQVLQKSRGVSETAPEGTIGTRRNRWQHSAPLATTPMNQQISSPGFQNVQNVDPSAMSPPPPPPPLSPPNSPRTNILAAVNAWGALGQPTPEETARANILATLGVPVATPVSPVSRSTFLSLENLVSQGGIATPPKSLSRKELLNLKTPVSREKCPAPSAMQTLKTLEIPAMSFH